MADNVIYVDIVADDHASSTFDKVKGKATAFGVGLSDAYNSFYRGLRNYNNAMWSFNRVALHVFESAGKAVYKFTEDAITNFMELEKQHSKTMGAMAADYDKTRESQALFIADAAKLKDQIYQLSLYGPTGRGSLYDVPDISSVQTALIKSGRSSDDILSSRAVQDIMEFAGGNELQLGTATDFSVQLGTQFDIPMTEWGDMLNMVTRAADLSIIEVSDIIESMSYAGNISSAMDMDLSEVLGMLTVMGNAGLIGSKAGTGVQSMITRLLTAAGNGNLSEQAEKYAPSTQAVDVYNKFVAGLVDKSYPGINTAGMSEAEIAKLAPEMDLTAMPNVAENLSQVFAELDDVETAWMAKKLFGLFQLKAGYALANGQDQELNLQSAIDLINNTSEGNNQNKYDIIMDTTYGQWTATKNAWSGFSSGIGESVSPFTSNILGQALKWIQSGGDYEFDIASLESDLDKVGQAISEKYSGGLAELVESIGGFAIDLTQVTDALSPAASGIMDYLLQMLQGDPIEALNSLFGSLDEVNTNIDGLPEDLQGLAEAARNLLYAFILLSTINAGAKVLQMIMTLGKPLMSLVGFIGGKLSANTNVKTANTNMSTTNANMKITNAMAQIAKFMAQTTKMTVYAGQVTVIGGNGTGAGTGAGGGVPGAGGVGAPLLGPWSVIYGSGNVPTAALPGFGPQNYITGNTMNTPLLTGEVGGAIPSIAKGTLGMSLLQMGMVGTAAVLPAMDAIQGLINGNGDLKNIIYGYGANVSDRQWQMLNGEIVNVGSVNRNTIGPGWNGMGGLLNGNSQWDDAMATWSTQISGSMSADLVAISSDIIARAVDQSGISVQGAKGEHNTVVGGSDAIKSFIQGAVDSWYYDIIASGGTVTSDQYRAYTESLTSNMMSMDKGTFESEFARIIEMVSIGASTTSSGKTSNNIYELAPSIMALVNELKQNNGVTDATKKSIGAYIQTTDNIMATTKALIDGLNGKVQPNQILSMIDGMNMNPVVAQQLKNYIQGNMTANVNVNVNVSVDGNGAVTSKAIRTTNAVDASWMGQLTTSRYGRGNRG